MVAITTELIDRKISKYTALLSDFCSQRNLLQPVSRLPPEALANIFTHAARDYHENNVGIPAFQVPSWVNATYVCHHWRSVALDCPALWAYHFTVSLRWTEELLSRSKQASLKIRIHYDGAQDDSWWSHLVEKVLSHAGRIKELRLDVPEKLLPKELLVYPTRLQILDIDTPWVPSRTVTIKQGDTIPLRTLKLIRCLLPWHSLNLSGVTTLFLEQVPAPCQPNLEEFLGTLSRMQTLTILHLKHVLPGGRGPLSGGAVGLSLEITLPCLVRLCVAAPLSTITTLMSYIKMPSKARVRLEIQPEDEPSDDDYTQISSVVSQRFSKSEDPTLSLTIRSLVIRFPEMTVPSFTISASECSDCDPRLQQVYPPDCSHLLMIYCRTERFVAGNVDGDHIISDICCSIPSPHVQNLCVFGPTRQSANFWRKTLGHFDGLQRMKLSSGHMPDLASLLDGAVRGRTEATSDLDSTSGRTFVPALEELDLDRIMFAAYDVPGIAHCHASLIDALATRQALRLSETACYVVVKGYGTEDVDEDEDEDEDDCQLCILGLH